MPTTQIGSVSMRYGSAANINQYQNNLYDKELVLEVNTIEKEANSGEYEYTYKLYQIVTENGVNTKLEIPLSSNLIDYLNKNGAFIKGTDSNYSEGLFTTKTEVKQENESFVVKNYFPIDQDTLEGDPYNNGSDFILTLQTISPSGSKEDKVIQCCDFYVTVDKYGRVKTIEAKPNSSIKDLDDATLYSAQKRLWKTIDLSDSSSDLVTSDLFTSFSNNRKGFLIGPKSFYDRKFENCVNFNINTEEDLAALYKHPIVIMSSCTEDENGNILDVVNSEGYIFFSDIWSKRGTYRPLTIFLCSASAERDVERYPLTNDTDIVDVDIIPSGLYKYQFISDQWHVVATIQKINCKTPYSDLDRPKQEAHYKGKISDTSHSGEWFGSTNFFAENKDIFVGTQKYEFLEQKSINKANLSSVDDLFTSLDLRPGIFNIQNNYTIYIEFIKSNVTKELCVCTGILKTGVATINTGKELLASKNEFFASDNFLSTQPVEALYEDNTIKLICDNSWLKSTDIGSKEFDSITITFSGVINVTNEFVPGIQW